LHTVGRPPRVDSAVIVLVVDLGRRLCHRFDPGRRIRGSQDQHRVFRSSEKITARRRRLLGVQT
jgi:hypothetical protein